MMPLPGWVHEADNRPSFREIKQKLDGMFAEKGTNISDEVEKALTLERGMSLESMVEKASLQDSSAAPPPVSGRPRIIRLQQFTSQFYSVQSSRATCLSGLQTRQRQRSPLLELPSPRILQHPLSMMPLKCRNPFSVKFGTPQWLQHKLTLHRHKPSSAIPFLAVSFWIR